MVATAVVLVNLVAWLAGDRLFLAEARQLDREKAARQIARIGKLLSREARNLQRIILSRADRLARDAEVRRSGLGAVDFEGSTSEVFLSGANIDAYLVEDSARQVLFARRREPSTDALLPMSAAEQAFLSALPSPEAAGNGGFAGLATTPDGSVSVVVGVPVKHQHLYGWLLARRDLDRNQVSTYGEVVESPFAIQATASGYVPADSLPDEIVIEELSGKVRSQLNSPAGQPVLQLHVAYDNEYEQHMAGIVTLSRAGLLLLSLLAGSLAGLLLWRRREEQRREAAMQLEAEHIARLAAVGELAAGVAHEVNNPIGMIRRNLDFVRDVLHDTLPLLDEREDADRLCLGGIDFAMARVHLPQLLDDMARGSQRIGEIVRDLKDFAREDAPDNSAPFDLNEAVAAAIRLLDGPIRKATDHFSLKLGSGLPSVVGNLRQIEQVVVNLVQNACQALADQRSAIAVVTRYDAGLRRILVEVADEGQGMTPEQRQRIFEPFFTTRRDSGGTGLGLSVSLRIVKRHGGSLDVDSVPGNGTVVTLSLPANKE